MTSLGTTHDHDTIAGLHVRHSLAFVGDEPPTRLRQSNERAKERRRATRRHTLSRPTSDPPCAHTDQFSFGTFRSGSAETWPCTARVPRYIDIVPAGQAPQRLSSDRQRLAK